MDFGSPVAAGVNVNPNQSIQTLSGLVGLKQQQQALQTGAIQQQTAQAQSQQEQQNARQRTGLANFMSTFDPTKHIGADGTLDLDSVLTDPQLRKAAGDQFPDVVGKMIDIKQHQLTAKQQLVNLNDSVRNQFLGSLGGLRTDPDVVNDTPAGRKKVEAAIGQFSASGPDAARIAQIYAPMVENAPQGKLVQGVSTAQLQAMDAANQAGRQAPVLTDTGTVLQNTNPQAAGGNLRGQPPITKDIEGAAAASARGSSRASGVASSDIDRANQVSAGIKSAQAGIQTTQQIDDLADQIHSGKFAAWVSKQAAAVGLSESTYARQLLEKDIGIIRTQMTSSAQSDSRAATILSGTPDATSDAQTIHGAMDYVRGSFRQNLSQGRNLAAYKTKHPDLSGFQGADDAFTGGAGPLVHEFLSLKGKDEQAAFYRRNFGNAQEALKFRNQARAAAHTLGLDNADR